MKYDPMATEMMDAENLYDVIMDLIVEELDIMKDGKKDVNFNLSKNRLLLYYTKWKRDLLDEEDKEGYFKQIERNKLRQRGLKRFMRNFVGSL